MAAAVGVVTRRFSNAVQVNIKLEGHQKLVLVGRDVEGWPLLANAQPGELVDLEARVVNPHFMSALYIEVSRIVSNKEAPFTNTN